MSTTAQTAIADEFLMIERTSITPSPSNPRKTTDELALNELAASIEKVGVLEPILVRRSAEQFEIIAGERRWLACGIANVDLVPAIVKDVSDEEVLEIQIIENLQRRDVHPLDESAGFQNLKDRLGWSDEEIGLRVGKSASYVAQRLKLRDLHETVAEAFARESLTLGHVLEIAKFPKDRQPELLELAVRKESRWIDGNYTFFETTVSVREFVSLINRKMLRRLSSAPFSISAADLRSDAMTCVRCPERTAAQGLLFGDTYDKDSCLNPACWSAKISAHVELERRRLAVANVIADADEKAVQKAADSIPILTSRWYTSDKSVVSSDSFEVIVPGRVCEHAEQGVFHPEDAERPGEIETICRTDGCPVHWPRRASSENKAEDDSEDRKIRKEEIFDAKVAEAVRLRVLKAAVEALPNGDALIKPFMAGFGVSGLQDVSARFAARLWAMASQDGGQDRCRDLLDDGLIPKGYDAGPTRFTTHFESLDPAGLAQIVFLLIYGREGEIYSANWSWKSQRTIRDLATVFGLNYAKLDAEERLAQAPAKLKDLYRAYLHDVEADNPCSIPRPWSSKWKPLD